MPKSTSQPSRIDSPTAERRKYLRVQTDQLLSIAPKGRGEFQARGRDLSPGGIQFRVVGCEIAMGESLVVTFRVGSDQVVASGRVVWATESDAWTTDVGLEFERVEGDGFSVLEALEAEILGSCPD